MQSARLRFRAQENSHAMRRPLVGRLSLQALGQALDFLTPMIPMTPMHPIIPIIPIPPEPA